METTKKETDAVHARGCSTLLARPSQTLEKYDYCPECKRMVLRD